MAATVSACKTPLPAWFVPWETWRLSGGVKAERPAGLPQSIPAWAWECLKERRPPKPAYVLPFTPPVAFYKLPDSATVGITEALAVFPGDIAVDLNAGSRTKWLNEFIPACRARGRKVYGWTMVWDEPTWDATVAWLPEVDGFFPNIEDDNLRAYGSMLERGQFLSHIAHTSGLMGVLTNYNVSPEWPVPNPLGHLAVLPEWFPSEIHDPSATIEGSLDSGRKHFAAALPLLDGRERGLAAFPYQAGAYCIWPADSVTDWQAWVR